MNNLAKKTIPQAKGRRLEVPAIEECRLEVVIQGTAPLLANPKTKAYLDEIEHGGKKSGLGRKSAKDPQQEFESRLRRLSDGSCGWPLEAFTGKTGLLVAVLSMVDARKMKLSKKNIFAAIQIEHDEIADSPEGPRAFLSIDGPEPVIDKYFATVMSGMQGVPIPVYRPRWDKWSLRLRMRFNPRLISADQIVTLLREGGRGVGLGAWRRANGGAFGTFDVGEVIVYE